MICMISSGKGFVSSRLRKRERLGRGQCLGGDKENVPKGSIKISQDGLLLVPHTPLCSGELPAKITLLSPRPG